MPLPRAKQPGDTWAKPPGNLCLLLQGVLLFAAWDLVVDLIYAPLLFGKSTLTRKSTPAVIHASFCDVHLYNTRVTHAAVVLGAFRCSASSKPNFVKALSLPSKSIFNAKLLSL